MTTRHEDLAAWRHSIALAAAVYAATRHLPSDEPLGLVRELRRAALCVPSSIAAGACGRREEFVHCLQAARSALAQLETQLVIAGAQALIEGGASAPLPDVTEVARDLDGLIRRVRAPALAAHARACAPQPRER